MEKEKRVTITQFKNILATITLLSNSSYILELSPDYIIEKYERYLTPANLVKTTPEWKTGSHQLLKDKIIEPYFRKWKPLLRKYKINLVLEKE